MALSSAVDSSAIARVVGIKTEFKNLRNGGLVNLPQRIVILAQGATASVYSATKRQITSALEAAQVYGFGSPIHLIARQLLPVNGDGVGTIPVTVYPLSDAGGSLAAAGTITPSGTQTVAASYAVRINNMTSVAFTIAAGDTVAARCTAIAAAINATLDLPVTAVATATEVTITAKWKGATGNAIYAEVVGSLTAGTTFVVVQPTGGATNPTIDSALAQVGIVWETLFVNGLSGDTTALSTFADWNEGRWGALTKKPAIAFVGNTEAVVATAIAVTNTRKTDRSNVQLVAPGSRDLPFVVAGRQVARLAPVANNNPPRDYGSLQVSGITPGTDAQQWTYAQRDQAVKGGSSTIDVRDSVVYMSDTVTMYHPDGDPIPAYRYVCDIVKLQQIIFNLNLIFNVPEWDGAPLIPDDQPTVNPSARKPKTAKAAVCALIDSLALNAIISDADFAKENTFAAINETNPKRLDVTTTVKLSGNANIISVDLNFGFYFGTAMVVQ